MDLENLKNKKMKKDYQLVIGSPVDYEELVIYIRINGESVALVQKEEGSDKMKIEFFGEPIKNDIYFDIFMESLLEAKKELLK